MSWVKTQETTIAFTQGCMETTTTTITSVWFQNTFGWLPWTWSAKSCLNGPLLFRGGLEGTPLPKFTRPDLQANGLGDATRLRTETGVKVNFSRTPKSSSFLPAPLPLPECPWDFCCRPATVGKVMLPDPGLFDKPLVLFFIWGRFVSFSA